jgi:RimJ/RimL family protein N-acetyltransferase
MASENSIQNPEASVADNLRGAALMAYLKKHCYSNVIYSIPIQNAPGLRLRMVSTIDPLEEDVIRLTNWRNHNVHSFLTEFEATPQRTRNWLTQAVGNDLSRILFMVEEVGHLPLGYIGLAFIDYSAHSAEADSVVRGEPGHPGIMSTALRALIDWAYRMLEIKQVGVRVLADNPAVAFYQKFGFREVRQEVLELERSSGMTIWKPTSHIDNRENTRRLIHMELID